MNNRPEKQFCACAIGKTMMRIAIMRELCYEVIRRFKSRT